MQFLSPADRPPMRFLIPCIRSHLPIGQDNTADTRLRIRHRGNHHLTPQLQVLLLAPCASDPRLRQILIAVSDHPTLERMPQAFSVPK